MKRTGFFIIALCLFLNGAAQEKKGGLSDFMKDELKDFDQFISEENKAFISFMREPWKEYAPEKPVEKRVKPEPVKPVVYDPKTAPKSAKPVCLSIEEILDLTSAEGKQQSVVKVKDVDVIEFEKPVVIVKKKKEPTVITIVERVEEKPQNKPVVEPERVADVPVAGTPVTKPVAKPNRVVEPEASQPEAKQPDVKQPERQLPEPELVPKQPSSRPKTDNSPLFAGGAGRSKINFGGRDFYVSNAMNRTCKLNGVTENAIADAYEGLCSTNYTALLNDCDQIRKALSLNEWGYFTLLRQVSDAYCSTADESVVMQQFLLNEKGYKAKMGRKSTDNKLLLFVVPDCQIYAKTYVVLNGQKYYSMDGVQRCQFYMCQKDSPKARNLLKMELNGIPSFDGPAVTSTHQAQGSAAKATVSVPKALADFYKGYPQCDYNVYFNAPVNQDVEYALLSSLAPFVKGKSEKDAANLLINYVQTAFSYKTDDDQFGYEKPFFVEELFYYPYSDCEDRSILFSYLVRKLTGLEVVLLSYPEHMATAVCFNEDVTGDYVMAGGKKYVVCDPTYIGAPIGLAMPQFKNVAAKVMKY